MNKYFNCQIPAVNQANLTSSESGGDYISFCQDKLGPMESFDLKSFQGSSWIRQLKGLEGTADF